MKERRMFERINAPLKIKYEVMVGLPSSKTAVSKDISGGGIKLALSENLEAGTELKLDIEIPSEKEKITSAYGKVMWSRKVEISGKKPTTYYETGIKFMKVNPLSIGKIFRYFLE